MQKNALFKHKIFLPAAGFMLTLFRIKFYVKKGKFDLFLVGMNHFENSIRASKTSENYFIKLWGYYKYSVTFVTLEMSYRQLILKWTKADFNCRPLSNDFSSRIT